MRTQAHADQIAAVLDRQREQRLGALAAAPGLGTADAGTMREIRAEMARQLEIINAEGVALVDRNAAQELYNRLLEASLVPRREAEALQRGETEAIEASARAQEAFLDALRRTDEERAKELQILRDAQLRRL